LVDLADARLEATRLRRLARSGGDPLAERRRERRIVPTFREAARQVHQAYAATFRNAKHKAQWLSSLEAYVFPVFGDRPVDLVETADVLKSLSPIWTKKPETARRLKQRIKLVLDWAKASGHRTGDNAVEGIAKVLPKVQPSGRHFPSLKYDQVPAFLQALRACKASESAKLAFEFKILTATRTGEVIRARWEEIDRPAKMWTVPGSRMKSGREHRVPLSTRCLQLLAAAEAVADGGPYVFPGRSPKAPLSNMVFLMILRRMARRETTGHGFRSSFRNWAAERMASTPRDVAEAALAHVVKDKTEAAYYRSDLFELRRKLMEAWCNFATTMPDKTGKALPMTRRRRGERGHG
jgi:integrase